ncbi:hypothetical protein FF011L_21480 [Roseimaritima multifibrata]|uniref:Uncharacterized protein n=1 Tax=Roseimaritima multifibrata TaxID=1930274 RepID=A0A517MES1_9BACT|nr:hypothetical protein FF011L_21480 [Roseimaritima multifibrata]
MQMICLPKDSIRSGGFLTGIGHQWLPFLRLVLELRYGQGRRIAICLLLYRLLITEI